MTKTELIDKVAVSAEMKKADVKKVIDAALEEITASMAAGEKVQIPGFGTFEVKTRGARTGINPRTKETIEIAESKAPSFKAGKALKDRIAE